MVVPNQGTIKAYLDVGFPFGSDGKESFCNTGDWGSIPGSGRSPGDRKGYPLQYSCLENPMGRGAWWVTAHGATKNRTWLSNGMLLAFMLYFFLFLF